jgi:hypothetical protein
MNAARTFQLSPAGKGQLCVIGGSVCISFAALFVKGAPMDPSLVAFYRLLFGGAAGISPARASLW